MERLVVVFNAFYAIERKVLQFIMPVGGCTPRLGERQKDRVGCWLAYDIQVGASAGLHAPSKSGSNCYKISTWPTPKQVSYTSSFDTRRAFSGQV